MRRGFGGVSAAMVLCVLLACELGEDGGGGGGFGPEQTVTLLSTEPLDGWVRDDGAVGTAGSQVVVGDLIVSGAARAYRGFYSFDLTSIAAGSMVTSADLRLYQFGVTGNPYTDLGNVIVDHLDYGITLDAPDYAAAALASNVGTISTTANFESKTLIVTARVQADVTAARPRAQFRIRFSTADSNNDGSADLAQFTDAPYVVTANRPQLVVKYREPVTP